MKPLPFGEDMKQSLCITEQKQFSHELYYGKENKLEIKVDEEDTVSFDILCKQKSQSGLRE